MSRLAVWMVVVAAAVLAWVVPVSAQWSGARRVAVDSVIGVQDIFLETRDWPTAVVFDPFVSAQIMPGLQAAVRPKFWRMNGAWELALDQASVQYERHWGSNWRIEAGRFPSPVGLGMTENRSNINPGVLWWHRPYYMPLPGLGDGAPRVSLVSAIYPDGVVVSTSADHWDARAAIVDRPPVEFWHGETGASRGTNTIVGAGVVPVAGVRIGVALAHGDLTNGEGGDYRMVNVEGEYAFGYTRISGEWTHDVFVMPAGRFVARGWTLQAQQTLAPRVFAHARATSIAAPEVTAYGTPVRTFRSIDTTVGYRVNAEVTARIGYSVVRAWNGGPLDHQAGLSLMWAKRWW